MAILPLFRVFIGLLYIGASMDYLTAPMVSARHDAELIPGDHLVVGRVVNIPMFQLHKIHHHGIFVWNGTVVEYTLSSLGVPRGLLSSIQHRGAGLRVTSIDEFAMGQPVFKANYRGAWNCAGGLFLHQYCLRDPRPPNEVISCAHSSVGTSSSFTAENYDVLSNNCEHFATFCKFGAAVALQPFTHVLGQLFLIGTVFLIQIPHF